LWEHLPKLARGSKRRQAAVAYVSDDSVIRFKKGDTLIVDASEGVIKGGLTSAKVLNRAFQGGVEIFSCPNLHAKVYVFDRTAVVGSSNTSESSADRLLEAAVITDEPSIVSASRKLIKELQHKSQRIGQAELQRLLKIPVERKVSFGTRRLPSVNVNPQPGATWLVATHPLNMTRYTKEEKRAERGQKIAEEHLAKRSSEAEWIRFSKNSNIAKKAQDNDWVIQMWSSKQDGRVFRVLRGAPIRYMQREVNCVRIYLEDFKNSESEGLRWGTFQKIARDAGIPKGCLGKRSIGVLTDTQADALESLWKAQVKLSRK